MVRFISLFLYILFTIGFSLLNVFPAQKIRNCTEEERFDMMGAITEPMDDDRVKPISEREIYFLLEIKFSSCS